MLLTLIVFALCETAGVVAWTRNTQKGPERERLIEKAFTRNAVVEISEIKVSQADVEPGKSFYEGDDWLNKVLLKVKNISDKPIVSLEVAVDFPDTTATGSIMSYRLFFGQRPESKFPQKHDPIFMKPGDMVEVPLSRDYEQIKAFIEHRQGIASIHKAELGIAFVVFADKTGWGAGNYYRQDPKNPDHYINVGDTPPRYREV